jgi:hypothetical protein
LHNEELLDLYCSPNIIQVKREMGEACGMYGGRERYIQDFNEET